MKKKAYIVIESWMVNELGLSGNELICYAVIYGFSQDGESEYKGSQSYLAECMNVTRETVVRILKELTKNGLIVRREEINERGKIFYYSARIPKEEAQVTKSNLGCEEMSHDNNKDKEENNKLFSKKDELFEECWVAYRRKGNKKKAKAVWNKLKDKEREKVKAHIEAYVIANDLKYQKDFERYLSHKTFATVVYKGNAIIFDPEQIADKETYLPQLDGFNLLWNDTLGIYISMYDLDMLADGYTRDDRPSSARVRRNSINYRWNVETKRWEAE